LSPEAPFDRWTDEVRPILITLMAELNIVQETYLLKTSSFLASSDQLRAIAIQLADWVPEHRCPIIEVGVAMTRLGRSLEWLAELLGSEANNPSGPDFPLTGQGIDGLHAAVSEVWTAMLRESER
jgi:hypothetical protein